MGQAAGKTMWERFKVIVFIGWVVAGIRFAMDFQENDPDIAIKMSQEMQWTAEWVGVYYAVPLLIIYGSIAGLFRGLSFVGLLKASLFLAVMCWTIPNAIVYPTAQFMEWEHGRFYSEAAAERAEAAGDEVAKAKTLGGETIKRTPRGPQVGETAIEKLGLGLMVAGLTTIAGFIWCLVWILVTVFIPQRHRAAA